MNSRTSYTLVGLFVIVLGVGFVAALLWLGSGSAGGRFETYEVYTTESVAGLSRDGVVKYRGVDVGHVREITLAPDNPEQVRLLLQIQEGTPIKEDTVATLEMRGLTGLAYVNLSGGSKGAAKLTAAQGAPYPRIPSRPSIWGRLDQNFGALLENLVEASHDLRAWLNEENRELLIETLRHLEQLSGTLAGRSDSVDRALQDLAQTLHNARAGSEQMPELVAELGRGAKAFEQMAKTLQQTGSDLQKTISARDRDLQRFTNNTLPEASAMVTDLRQTAANLLLLSERLKRDPSIILRGTPPGPLGPGEQETAR